MNRHYKLRTIFLCTTLLCAVHPAFCWWNKVVCATAKSAASSLPFNDETGLPEDVDANMVSVACYDGLGRPTANLLVGNAPNRMTLATLTEYDSYGREVKTWLHAPLQSIPENSNSIKTAALQYYGNNNRPYVENLYENLMYSDRLIGSIAQGGDMDGKKKQREKRANNTENTVKHFCVKSNTSLECTGNYANGTLVYETLTDEDGKTLSVFVDKAGRKVMERRGGNTDTYYVYDDIGQLCYVLPPLAADAFMQGTINDDNSTLKKYAYLYKYDERGNCTYKRLPGCEPIYMVYDKANRLVLSQDGNQRANGKWVATIYDQLGRVIMSFLRASSTETHQQLETQMKQRRIVEYPAINNSVIAGYTCAQMTGAIDKMLTVNYYDNYDFLQLFPQGTANQLAYHAEEGYAERYENATGLLTGIRVYLLDGSGNYTVTAIHYDRDGRVAQTHAINHAGGITDTYNLYGFTGNLLSTKTVQAAYGHTTTEEYTYTYDHAMRPLTTIYKVNNMANSIILAENVYDSVGRLQKTRRHNGTDSIVYNRNIRNWLTKIKSGSFEERINYGTLRNGNIASTAWTYGNEVNGAYYYYDGLNRLTQSSSFTGWDNSGGNLEYEEAFYYDKMGNITLLFRDSKKAGIIDVLDLRYDGNRLMGITDEYGNSSRYGVKEYHGEDPYSHADKFAYDANGNMVKDLDRNIVTIRYNCLNLPDTIQFINGNQIIYFYDASGIKYKTDYITSCMSMTVPIGSAVSWTFGEDDVGWNGHCYLGNIQYDFYKDLDVGITYSLGRINNPEGYRSGWTMYYYHRDHLGNVREVWNATTQATLQRTQYYVHGLPYAESKGAIVQPYKYNAKEFCEMHGYDAYDYGFRTLYPAIGRFTTPDPLCEKYYDTSPYAYCANNPVRFIDPTGLAPIYAPDGTFLGTDDEGLRGVQLILDRDDFTQGMAHADAQKVLWAGQMTQEARAKMDEHFAGLSLRPDYDGFVSIAEGIAWAKKHPNALKNPTPDNTLYVDASKLDFGGLSTSDFIYGEGGETPINLFDLPLLKSALLYTLRSTVYALGRVDMILESKEQKTVRIVNNSATDYDWNLGGGAKRDFFIRAERRRAGLDDTHGFKTFYYGIGRLKK